MQSRRGEVPDEHKEPHELAPPTDVVVKKGAERQEMGGSCRKLDHAGRCEEEVVRLRWDIAQPETEGNWAICAGADGLRIR